MPRIIHGGMTEGPKVESREGVLGEGQQPPPHQLWGLGSTVNSCIRVRVRALTA